MMLRRLSRSTPWLTEISTDVICDYTYYPISDFHVHPVHGGTLAFLKDPLSQPSLIRGREGGKAS